MSVAVNAALALAAAHAGATTIVSDTFDTYTNGASLTTAAGGSWAKDGTGTAAATTAAGLPETGAGAGLLTPSTATTGNWVYKPNTVITNPAGSAEAIVTASAALRITSPATATANRSVVLGLQTYDSAVNLIGSATVVWDSLNTYGFGANHLVLQFGWGDGSSDFGYDFGVVTSAQLASIGYFDVSVSLDYASGDIAFGWGNTALGHAFAYETTHGSFNPATNVDFSDADVYYARGSTGGTLPRLLVDNYSITTAPSASSTYTLGGTASGADLAGLVLQNNGGDNLAINAAGTFTFATPLAAGAPYNVTVLSSPSGQTCGVTNATGNMPSSNVTNIAVACTVNTYALSGSVQNLAGSGLQLSLTAGSSPVETVSLAAGASSFSFATPVATGAQWSIAVAHQPETPYQTCTVTPSSGTMPASDVSDIVVACVTNAYTVGGSASGIDVSGLVLQLNGGNDLPINANGAFVFATAIDSGTAYAVTILSQPSGRSCTLSNASGTVGGQNVSDVGVSCIALPLLVLSATDSREFARYGMVVDYTVTLANNGDGDAANVAVALTLSAGFDGVSAQLTCSGTGSGATCAQDAGNPLLFHVGLPAHRTLTWLVTVPVRADTPDETVELSVAADGATTVIDTDTLVIFRDSFDVSPGDGTLAAPILAGATAQSILAGDTLFEVSVPGTAATTLPLLIVRDDTREVQVEYRRLVDLDLVRLREREAGGAEHATPWGLSHAGATLEFGSEANAPAGTNTTPASRSLFLVGPGTALTLPH